MIPHFPLWYLGIRRHQKKSNRYWGYHQAPVWSLRVTHAQVLWNKIGDRTELSCDLTNLKSSKHLANSGKHLYLLRGLLTVPVREDGSTLARALFASRIRSPIRAAMKDNMPAIFSVEVTNMKTISGIDLFVCVCVCVWFWSAIPDRMQWSWIDCLFHLTSFTTFDQTVFYTSTLVQH